LNNLTKTASPRCPKERNVYNILFFSFPFFSFSFFSSSLSLSNLVQYVPIYSTLRSYLRRLRIPHTAPYLGHRPRPLPRSAPRQDRAPASGKRFLCAPAGAPFRAPARRHWDLRRAGAGTALPSGLRRPGAPASLLRPASVHPGDPELRRLAHARRVFQGWPTSKDGGAATVAKLRSLDGVVRHRRLRGRPCTP